MAGGGFALDAIKTVRANRSLLKKRKFKDIKSLVLEVSGKTELEFKKISAEELAKVKSQIKKQNQKNVRKETIIYILSTVITFGILYAMYIWII